MHKHIDSWKNSTNAFDSQLRRNVSELEGSFPPHWDNFLHVIRSTRGAKRVVDVGCGAGAYAFLSCKNGLDYIGYDYSEYAVSLAEKFWGFNFIVSEYEDLTPSIVKDGDILVANALCDVLPDGNKCLKHLLSLGFDDLLIQRVRITDKQSHFLEYQAYDIMTYEFYHNKPELLSLVDDHGYSLNMLWLYDNIYDLVIGKK